MIATLLGLLRVCLLGLGKGIQFAYGKALVLWAFFSVALPKIFETWRTFRLLRFAALGAVFYAIYRVIHDTISAVVVAVNLSTGISSLITDLSWASWLLWDGPLQMSVLWDQLVSCVSFKISLNVIAYSYTKIMWYTGTLFSGGIGPRR